MTISLDLHYIKQRSDCCGIMDIHTCSTHNFGPAPKKLARKFKDLLVMSSIEAEKFCDCLESSTRGPAEECSVVTDKL